MPDFYSPDGNPEIWAQKPKGYFTPEEWFAAHPQPEPPEPDIDELKAAKIAEILAISAVKMAKIEEGYSEGEVKTFEQQYAGAVDLLAGNTDTAAAQFVAALAAKRSEVGGVEVTPEQLSERIIANYTAAKEYTAVILGVQQGLETRVYMAQTAEEVAAVVWE